MTNFYDSLGINGGLNISANSTTDAIYVSQLGTGNAMLIEDSANPDLTPFIINSGGSVNIGRIEYLETSSGTKAKLQVNNSTSQIPFSGLPFTTNFIVQGFNNNNIGFFTTDVNTSQLYFGTPSSVYGAKLSWYYTGGTFDLSTQTTGGTLTFGTDQGIERMRILSNGNIGIGTTAATETLTVNGSIGATTISGGTFYGDGSNLTGISGGTPTLQQVLDFNHDLANGNNFQGTGAGVGNTGTNVIAIGANSANSNTGCYVSAFGTKSAEFNTANSVIALGFQSAYCNTGCYVTASGTDSAYCNTGCFVTASGYRSAFCNIGSNITAFGSNSAKNNTGNCVNALGRGSASGNTGDFVTALGTNSAYGNIGNFITALGVDSAFCNTGGGITASGYRSTFCNIGSGVAAIGTKSAYCNTGNQVTALGFGSAFTNSGNYVTASGYLSAYCNTGSCVTASGYQSAYCNTGDNIIALGYNVGNGNGFSGVFIVANTELPSYTDRPTAQATITLLAGAVANNTYLYYNQSNGAIEGIRL